jgi:hypothetical protein
MTSPTLAVVALTDFTKSLGVGVEVGIKTVVTVTGASLEIWDCSLSPESFVWLWMMVPLVSVDLTVA